MQICRKLTVLHPVASRAATMLTFRRALVAAAFFITVLFLTTRSSPPASAAPETFPRAQAFSGSSKKASTTAPSDSNPIHGGPTRHHPSRSGQKAMQDMSKLSLNDKLAYQFPYDVETRFPAYIWQTWK